jgi:hypothetical protein
LLTRQEQLRQLLRLPHRAPLSLVAVQRHEPAELRRHLLLALPVPAPLRCRASRGPMPFSVRGEGRGAVSVVPSALCESRVLLCVVGLLPGETAEKLSVAQRRTGRKMNRPASHTPHAHSTPPHPQRWSNSRSDRQSTKSHRVAGRSPLALACCLLAAAFDPESDNRVSDHSMSNASEGLTRKIYVSSVLACVWL